MRILLAEDEKALSRAVATVLQVKGGYEVDAVYDGEAALEAARQNVYDVCVFDIMMPKMDGITALETLRREGNTTPVLMLTAKAELDDRVKGLDAGADDYLPKPFQMAELLARLRSLTRRAGHYSPKQLQIGNVTLDLEQQELKAENSIRLAKKEARLMEFVMANPEKAFSEEELLTHVWKDEDVDGQVVWVYISYLKSKLDAISAEYTIEGEPGGPYHLVPDSRG
ncbi:MAG: response regulator transcription factor [Eubacterium sp.]|nr:response regulator transcription factor [Eubacterium sp.]